MPPERQRRPAAAKGQAKARSEAGFGSPAAKGSADAAPPPPSARSGSRGRSASQVIPDHVANRMARRIALATGIPTLMGMGVFVGSYLLVSRGLLDIPPSATLLASGACFLLGLLGLSYGVLSSSWEEQPGSLLGMEQMPVNLGRLRESIRSMRQAGPGGSQS